MPPTNGSKPKTSGRLTIAKVLAAMEENTALTKRTIRDLGKRIDKIEAKADDGFHPDDDTTPAEIVRRLDDQNTDLCALTDDVAQLKAQVDAHVQSAMIDPAINLAEMANLVDTGIVVTLTLGDHTIRLEKAP